MCIRGLEAAPDVADSGICHALEVCKRGRSSSSATLTGSSLESEYIISSPVVLANLTERDRFGTESTKL
jgi:hypothetical protein